MRQAHNCDAEQEHCLNLPGPYSLLSFWREALTVVVADWTGAGLLA